MPSKQAPEQIYHEPEVADNLKPSPFFQRPATLDRTEERPENHAHTKHQVRRRFYLLPGKPPGLLSLRHQPRRAAEVR